jgi:hypothetical protein
MFGLLAAESLFFRLSRADGIEQGRNRIWPQMLGARTLRARICFYSPCEFVKLVLSLSKYPWLML